MRPDVLPASEQLGLFDVLEHIEDDIGTLARLRDVLKPDGRLYITVPSYSFLFSMRFGGKSFSALYGRFVFSGAGESRFSNGIQ